MLAMRFLLLGPIVLAFGSSDPDSFETLRKPFAAEIRPLMAQFCLTCHSTAKSEGDLDLERFAKLDDVRRDPRVWEKVVEMLDNGEMPPKKKPQPSDAERAKIRHWARSYLDTEARANAGDPGSVLLRRLGNVEYDNTIRDLTGVDLRPAHEFPVDGAAGEGFTNVGEALAMSPALLDKYVASAKGIASHAVLLPDGFRFSNKASRRDWTDELMTEIRAVYFRNTASEGSTRVNLQGIISDTNAGGRIPLERYLTAAVKVRTAKADSLERIARESGISPKYLRIVVETLNAPVDGASPLLDHLRTRWTGTKNENDITALAAEIRQWQTVLTKFNSVAHFKKWQEPVNPLVDSRELRVKLDTLPHDKNLTLFLTVKNAGDGDADETIEWQEPRLEAAGRAPIFLSDLRDGLQALARKRAAFSETSRYLAAVEELRTGPADFKPDLIAKERNLDPILLAAWSEAVGIGRAPATIDGVFTQKLDKSGNYDFVKGWGTPETPSVIANSSDNAVRVPGHLKPHSVAVHPSPDVDVAIGWRSPLSGRVRVEARVVHAHPDCGNGVSWSLELRRAGERRRLTAGVVDLGKAAEIEPISDLAIYEGDVLSLIIGPRDRNHSCDLTEVELAITEETGAKRNWVLSRDVSGDILKANPHPDSLDNRDIWLFYAEKPGSPTTSNVAAIPRDSLLDRWCQSKTKAERAAIAEDLQQVLTGRKRATASSPDAALVALLHSASGPIFGRLDFAKLAAAERAETKKSPFEILDGLERQRFVEGSHSLKQTSSTLRVGIPIDLAKGREFAANARIISAGSLQVFAGGEIASINAKLAVGRPILVQTKSPARAKLERSFADFRRIFPAAVCYPQIVPVDEVVTLVQFHRDDEELRRLILDEAETRKLDRLWDELQYVSQDALKVQEAYSQFMEYVTQDGDVRLFEPLRKPINDRAEAFKKRLQADEPKQIESLIAFAAKASRRPLMEPESAELWKLYERLRNQKLDHDAAFRLLMTRILVSPSFLYHIEEPADGPVAKPVSDWELASRLSYFLWSSQPDDELRLLAENHTLHQPEVLNAQTVRMLKDARARSLATEFACQWLDVRGFDAHDEKSETFFPKFAKLRESMYGEIVRFSEDLFARNGSVLDFLDADHTFVDGPLAEHYGIPDVTGPEWRRVEGVKARGRGGILGMAALLAKHSGASRTSPILRGNWFVETLLGEKLPKPPKNVPQLPESELDTNGLTMRQITEKHRALESCSKCHDKFDPFGFALEKFDAIGSRRENDLGGRAVDTRAKLKDGTEFDDIAGLRAYVLARRRDEFIRNFCRKLLGYSLGRSVQLSDEPLIDAMQTALKNDQGRVHAAFFTIINSPQFRMRRGLSSPLDHDANP